MSLIEENYNSYKNSNNQERDQIKEVEEVIDHKPSQAHILSSDSEFVISSRREKASEFDVMEEGNSDA